MPQHPFTIPNQTFPSFRADLNNALQAIASLSSGATAPSTTFAYQLWVDTTNNLLKMRNAANSAWITLGLTDQTGLWVMTRSGTPQANIAGTFVGQLALDTANNKMYACTTSGSSSTAVWDSSPFISTLQGYVYGLRPRHNSTTPNAKVDIPTGVCMDSTNKRLIVVDSTLTADLAASGANGLDTPSEASNTHYHLWVIMKDDGTTASLWSASLTSPTMPSGYVYKRRLASYRNDASSNLIRQNILKGWPYNPIVQYDVTYSFGGAGTTNVLTAGTATSFTSVSLASYLPPTAVESLMSWSVTTGSTFSLGAASTGANRVIIGGSNGGEETQRDWVPTDSSQAIEYKRLTGSASLYLDVAGYSYEL